MHPLFLFFFKYENFFKIIFSQKYFQLKVVPFIRSEYEINIPGFIYALDKYEFGKTHQITTNDAKSLQIALRFMRNISNEFHNKLKDQKRIRHCSYESMLKVEEYCYHSKFDDMGNKLSLKTLEDLFSLEREFKNENFYKQLLIASYRSYMSRGMTIAEALELAKDFELHDLEGRIYGDILRY